MHWAELENRLILTLVLAGIALFILYPIVSVVATSFFKDGHFTLEYYRELASGRSLKLIRNSLGRPRCPPSSPRRRRSSLPWPPTQPREGSGGF